MSERESPQPPPGTPSATRPKDPAPSENLSPINRLRAIMARLRTPVSGCPWDLEQSFASIAPYTIEEAYEVADAVSRNDFKDLKEELGDLLLQVVFHAQMAEEQGLFGFDDVAAAINAKMIERHPHVFGDAPGDSPGAVTETWEGIKAKERAGKGLSSVLDGVALALPALLRAEKLQKRAARIGFDWNDPHAVLAKIEEEIAEIRGAMESGSQEQVGEEVGDLLFAAANLARHLKVDPETALRQGNSKFERRFRQVETRAAGRTDLETLEALWQDVKREEKKTP